MFAKDLLRRIVKAGLLKQDRAKAFYREWGGGEALFRALIDQAVLSEVTLTKIVAQALVLPCCNLQLSDIDAEAVGVLPYQPARRCRILPLKITPEGVVAAMAWPLDLLGEHFIHFGYGLPVIRVLTPEQRLLQLIDVAYGYAAATDLQELTEEEKTLPQLSECRTGLSGAISRDLPENFAEPLDILTSIDAAEFGISCRWNESGECLSCDIPLPQLSAASVWGRRLGAEVLRLRAEKGSLQLSFVANSQELPFEAAMLGPSLVHRDDEVVAYPETKE